MNTYLSPCPCLLRQALAAAGCSGAPEEPRRLILHHVRETLRSLDAASTPPEIGDATHRIAREGAGARQPYRRAKPATTSQALALYPRLKPLVANASDQQEAAVRLAIAGNVIDQAPNSTYDLWVTVEPVLEKPVGVDCISSFRRALASADRILCLADNAGEAVFARVLMEALGKPVTYTVKGGPVINNATMDDTIAVGLDQVAEVVTTGCDGPGTVLRLCSLGFRRFHGEAEMIIAKGQSSYEPLSGEGERLFFLLQTKCTVIARDIGVAVADTVPKQGSTT